MRKFLAYLLTLAMLFSNVSVFANEALSGDGVSVPSVGLDTSMYEEIDSMQYASKELVWFSDPGMLTGNPYYKITGVINDIYYGECFSIAFNDDPSFCAKIEGWFEDELFAVGEEVAVYCCVNDGWSEYFLYAEGFEHIGSPDEPIDPDEPDIPSDSDGDYEEISMDEYFDYEEQWYDDPESFYGRRFKMEGTAINISRKYFAFYSDDSDSYTKINGTLPADCEGAYIALYCSVSEDSSGYFLVMDGYDLITPAPAPDTDEPTGEIYTEDDLKAIATIQVDYPDVEFSLMNDIVLSGDWTPFEFNGVLRGNDYTISNLNVISDQEYTYDYAGLFSINNGEIYDLTVETSDLGVLSLRGNTASAGIVAGLNNGVIEDVYAYGTVIGASRTGGIAGVNSGEINACFASYSFENSYSYVGGIAGLNSGTIESSWTDVDITAAERVGAIAGNNSGYIYNSYADGEIIGNSYVGGLIGFSSGGEIAGCYFKGSVESNGRDYTGGLVGNCATPVSDCYAEANVIGYGCTGGLIGYATKPVENCYAEGNIVGKGNNNVGGLIGQANANVINCSFVGAVKSSAANAGGLVGYANNSIEIADCYARATVQGTDNIGGLVGYAYCGIYIMRCYTEGSIIANSYYAGGLAGRYYSRNRVGKIENSYSNTDVWGQSYVGGLIGYYDASNGLNVRDCYETGGVEGTSYVGGLVGYQETNGNFYNCYAVGEITGTSYVGGITGWRESISSALIEKCYYDTETTGMAVSENGIGKTTSEMKKSDTYIDWDFDVIWGIDSDMNNGYPYLLDNFSTNTQDLIVISDEEDLRAISENLSAHYILDDDIELTDSWETIGDSNLAFYGVLDGNGYTIKNLNVEGENSAFFHTIAVSGVVKNLNIEIGEEIYGSEKAAGITLNNYGTIDNCYVKGKIRGEGYDIGGIASINYSKIKNSHTETEVAGASGSVGGIVGTQAKGSIENCFAVGSVQSSQNAGGVVGYVSGGTITKSAAGGTVRITGNNAGGLIGNLNLTTSNSFTAVEECYSTATVGCGGNYAGGLIGYMYGYSSSGDSYRKYIKNCYSMGTVRGNNNAGAFAGYEAYNWGFENCYVSSASQLTDISSYSNGDWTIQKHCYFVSDYVSPNLFIAKTSEELKNEKTFAEWDFENIWSISKGNMPTLKNAPSLTADNTYKLIQSEDDLRNIANDKTGKYRLATDITISYPWEMIDTFEGILDGNGFTITNKAETEDGIVYPLFDTINIGGVVKNLVIDAAVDTRNAYCSAAGLASVNHGLIDSVTVKGSVKGSSDCTGGIVAYNYGEIYSSACEADVEGYYSVGGIAGYSTRNIVKAISKGMVTGDNKIGGIAGYLAGGNIKNSASYSCVYGNYYVGGVAGYMENANVSYSYAKGEVGTLYENSGEGFGGLVGYVYNTQSGRTPISYCYSSAFVKGYNNTGGLIGQMYVNGTYYIKYCYTDGEVYGNSYVGSFTGRQWEDYYETLYYQDCYSNAKTGGCSVVGSNSIRTVYGQNSYYNMSTSGKTSDSYFKALTDDQAKIMESYENWDFENVWAMSDEENGGYPYLKAVGTDEYSAEDSYDYVLIHNEEELYNIRKNLTGKYKLANDIVLKEVWQPVGTEEKPFNGVLDGDGHTIKNLHILCNEEYEYNRAALFGCIGRIGVAKNLNIEVGEDGITTMYEEKYAAIVAADNYGKIENCNVSGTVTATEYVGGIAARNYGRIENVSADVNLSNECAVGGIAACNSGSIRNAEVRGNISSAGSYVGGIVGENIGYVNEGTANKISVKGENYVGGIVGCGGAVYSTTFSGTVEGNCYVGGISGQYTNVVNSSVEGTVTGNGDIGGIVGHNSGKNITGCSFKGDIEGDIDSAYSVGGIAGYISGEVTNCYAETNIVAYESVGGIVGYSEGNITDSNAVVTISAGGEKIGGIAGYSNREIRNCYAEANISGGDYTGGIVGRANGGIYDVYAKGNITGKNYTGGIAGETLAEILNSYSDVNVAGREFVGGIAGYTNGNVSYCYSFSDVTGSNYIGGLIGHIDNGGNVVTNFAKGDVVGSDYVGGFAGENSGYVQYNYSIGKVKASGSNIGGFLGALSGRILNCYYNSDLSGMSDTGRGIPKTDEQMKKESVYIGWDFEEVWMLDSSVNDGYPFFEGYEDKIAGEETVIEISTKEDFYNIMNNPRGSYKLTKDIKLDENIEPLGKFSGTLDGDGHKVYGFSMNVNTGDFGGLFTELLAGSEVKNLNIEYSEIKTDKSLNGMGALAGRNFGTVTNVSATGKISAEGLVGGLVGVNHGVIESSSSSGTVSGGKYVGGLAGENNLNIYNCQSKATVYGDYNTGGLVGYDNCGYISLSSATGSVSQNVNFSGDNLYVGGLVGYAYYSDIDRCLSSNAVSGGSYTGGLVGYASDAYITQSTSSSVVTGEGYTGGFVGKADYTMVENSYANGSVTGRTHSGGFVGDSYYSEFWASYAKSIVKADDCDNIGGFAGYTEYSSYNFCYANADVTGYNQVGGFAGYTHYRDIFVGCGTDGMVTGTNYNTGGFAGYHYRYGTFEDCFSRVKVNGRNSVQSFIGSNNYAPQIYNCFYDATNNSYKDGYATGLTADEIAGFDQYGNWEFGLFWIMNEEISEYPFLAWQNAPGDLPTVIPAISVSIETNAYAVSVGEALSLNAVLYPLNSTSRLIWSSSNEKVAIVKDDGTVIAVSEGIAEITVTAGEVSDTIEIEVIAQNKSGNIVNVVTKPYYKAAYGKEIDEMLVMLPSIVEVMLSTGVIASLEVSWRYIPDSEYDFTGTIIIPEGLNVTNTNNISAEAHIEMEAEYTQPKEIEAVPEITLGVVNGTSLSTVMSMLPAAVKVSLDDGEEASLTVAWSDISDPYYNGFTSGDYIFTGKLVLPTDGSIKNTAGYDVYGVVTVAEEEGSVKNITSAMAQKNILIKSFTTLNDVAEMFPKEVYAVVDDAQTISLPVVWSMISTPEYSPRVAGTYVFSGAFILPEDGSITNVLGIKPVINVVVESSVSEDKTISVIGKTAEIGTTTEVSVVIDENTKMASGSIVIDFDSSLMTPTGYEIGSVIEGTSAMVNINYIDPVTLSRKVKVSWVGTKELSQGGEIVKVKFLVSEGAKDGDQIRVTVSENILEDMQLNIIPVKISEGYVTAVKIITGDINGDGKVSIQDAFRILLSTAGMYTLSDKQLLAADVNGDGAVDIFDAMRIQKFDIGLSDTLN